MLASTGALGRRVQVQQPRTPSQSLAAAAPVDVNKRADRRRLHASATEGAELTDNRPSTSQAAVASPSSNGTAAHAANGAPNGARNGQPLAAVVESVQRSAQRAAPSGSSSGSDSEGYEGVVAQPQSATGLKVRVRNMVKHFATAKGVFRAVDGIDVDIEPSSITALLGPSGSGKTTLLRLVAGLEKPTSGRILFDELDATELEVQDRQIGMVFQSYALFNHKTVAQNIKFGLEVRNLPIDHDKRCADLLELVQLTKLGDRFPRQLSGGQRQRVALARALASNPQLLLLDEPFGALDAVVRKQLRMGLKEIVRSVGVTTIIVTHDQEEAFDLADKVVIFNRGIVEQQGTPTDIIRGPATPFVMKFVGDTNAVPAGCLLVRRSRCDTNGKSQVMFRPTDIQLFTEYVETVDGHLTTPATVSEKVNLGWTVKYTLQFDDEVEVEWSVTREQADGAYALDVGQRIWLNVKPEAMMGFDQHEVESAPLV